MNRDALERAFPGLAGQGATVTSPETPMYNCIAWAAGDCDRWWWPSVNSYWPEAVIREETLGAFVEAFATLGFTPTDTAQHREGFEKVAIYVDASDVPTHAARQLPSGRWTSKLGQQVDIEHQDPESVTGARYGRVAVVLERPTAAAAT